MQQYASTRGSAVIAMRDSRRKDDRSGRTVQFARMGL